MKKIRYWLRNVFGFSGREINGFSVLTLLLVLAVAAPFLFGLLSTQPPAGHSADIRKLDSLRLMLREHTTETVAENKAGQAASRPFNPNDLSAEQWQAMGLPRPIAQRIINYRQKGGRFRAKTDLLKIYGFPEDTYQRLASFILLPDSLPSGRKQYRQVLTENENKEPSFIAPVKAQKPVLSFDLNRADSTTLMQIKGIGPGLSRRIINYRTKLGGFYDKNQVQEVYGLDSVAAAEVLTYAYVTDPVIKKLPVNTATVQELDAHPYITPKVANIMVDYRNQHGRYTSLASLYQIRALDKATLDKLAPYLSFE
jgi:competence protein ComEA